MFECKNLTVEYQKNPIGIDVSNPRFSWQLVSDHDGSVQIAYHIVVKTADETVWDSKRIESDSSVLIEYAGAPLGEATAYSVLVTVWDNHGDTAAASACFEMGLLSYRNFAADWITHTLGG